MNVDGIPSGTNKVLKECLDLFSSPFHESYTVPYSDTKNFSSHPEIQYFQKIKAKHHYSYHKSKSNRDSIDKIYSKMTVFDPFSRESLLTRLSTFTALNWNVLDSSKLTELKCARNGWKCISISLNNNRKNNLLCTSCNQQLILKFNEVEQVNYVLFEFDIEDYKELNASLEDQYIQKIIKDGHHSSCPWRSFETSLEDIYYPRPYINSTNEYLINNYLKILKNLIDNHLILSENNEIFGSGFLVDDKDIKFTEFIRISNNWLLNRYFKDDKENFSSLLDYTPRWYYKIAMLGWSLNIQSFSNQLVLLFICTQCNKRYFLNSAFHPPVNKSDISSLNPSIGLHISSSKILTPCTYPITDNHNHGSLYDLNDFETDDANNKFDIINEHKSWCCNIGNIDENLPFHEYFIDMVIVSEKQRGNDGEFNINSDTVIDIDSVTTKKKRSFDVNDGLEKLNKLRKLYLLDE